MHNVKIFVLFLMLIFVYACRSSKPASSGSNVSKSKEYDADDIIKRAKKQLGTRYRTGGKSPGEGFDCSGFTRYVFESQGIKLPPTAASQSKTGKGITKEKASKGDLIFFKGGDKNSKAIGHVGIVTGGRGDDIEFIHASTSKGIMISKLNEKYFRERFVMIRRLD